MGKMTDDKSDIKEQKIPLQLYETTALLKAKTHTFLAQDFLTSCLKYFVTYLHLLGQC